MARVKKGLSTEERRKKERERKRKYRENLKVNQEQVDRIREYDRNRKRKDKEEGKIKTISEMTEREKRCQRKKWRDATSRHRKNIKNLQNAETFVREHTPPQSPTVRPTQMSSSERNKIAGQRRSRQRRERDKKEINSLRHSLAKAKKRSEKWCKKYKRLKIKTNTSNDVNSPSKMADKIIRSGPTEVRKNLIVGAALSMQLKENSKNCKSQKEKKLIAENICGNIVSKKKFVKETLEKDRIVSPYYLYQATKLRYRQRKQRNTHINTITEQVKNFFEDSENSCQAPGKRDYVTRKKVQKQKRYLLLPLKELHKKFKEQTGFTKICYQTFIKLKPFWVVPKRFDKRDTCLCKMHANFKFMLDKLKLLRIIKSNSISQIVKGSVCNTNNIKCMYSTCKTCSLKIPDELLVQSNFDDFDTFYYRWTDLVEHIKSKKTTNILKVKRTVKEKVMCSATKLLQEANQELRNIAVHIFNMLHQHRQYKSMKKELTENEALIICDWSENYSCKYGEEVQSIHFGASRKQVSLHTGVVYIGKEIENQKLLFCTVSNSTNHGASAIWTHLDPVLKLLREQHPGVNILHFFTDGPTSQYKNKTNFFLMCKVCADLNFEYCSWNFWEAGHGKGPADGIGGLVKRTCDRSVAMGNDITDAATVMKTIIDLNICTFQIHDNKFEEFENELKKFEEFNKLLPVPGTMKLKSVIWTKQTGKWLVFLRRLSCSTCRISDCEHYLVKPKISQWTLVQPKDVIYSIEDNPQNKKARCQNYASSSREAEDLHTHEPLNATSQNRKKLRVEDIFSSSSEGEDQDLEENSFVVVKCEGKKLVYHYVAKVLEEDSDGDICVSFLRLACGGKFVFPNISEERSIRLENIVKRLKYPVVSRGRHYFKEDLSVFCNLG